MTSVMPKQVDDFDDLAGEYARGGPGTRRVRYEFDQRPTSRKAGCLAVGMLLVVIALTGCALTGGALGGREKCWAPDDRRAASLWQGTLEIDATVGAPQGARR